MKKILTAVFSLTLLLARAEVVETNTAVAPGVEPAEPATVESAEGASEPAVKKNGRTAPAYPTNVRVDANAP